MSYLISKKKNCSNTAFSPSDGFINTGMNSFKVNLGIHYHLIRSLSLGLNGAYGMDLNSYLKNSTGKYQMPSIRTVIKFSL